MKVGIKWITMNIPLVNWLTCQCLSKGKTKRNKSQSLIRSQRLRLRGKPYLTVVTLCLFLYTSTVQTALSASIGVSSNQSQASHRQHDGQIVNYPTNDKPVATVDEASRHSVNLKPENGLKKALATSSVKTPLFDGKLESGFQTDQLTLVTMSLAQKQSISAIDVYGLADFTLSGEAQINGQWYAIENIQSVDLRQLTDVASEHNESNTVNSISQTPSTEEGWHRLFFSKKITTNKLRLRLKPLAGNPTQALKELRLVDEGNVIDVETASYIQDQGEVAQSADNDIRLYRAKQPIQTVNRNDSIKQSKQAEFNIDLGYTGDQIEKAYLHYTLLGVKDALEVTHRINDQLSIGGMLTVKDEESAKSSVIRHEEPIPTSSLRLGRNHLYFNPVTNSDYQVMDVGLRIVLKPDQVDRSTDLALTPKSMSKMELTFPKQGQYLGSKVYVRGFVEADDQGRYPNLTILDYSLEVVDGLFEGLIPRGDSDQLIIKANWADGHEQELSQTLSEDMTLKGYALSTLLNNGEAPQGLSTNVTTDVSQTAIYSSFQVAGNLQQKKQVSLNEDKQATLDVSGSQLNVPLNSVSKALTISGVGLRERDMATLEMGMVNVTKAVSGYRFLPHGMQFDQAIKVSLPYDKALIPPGYSEDDIRSYYFDPLASRWVPLERTLVDIKMSRIESESNHFTDMINAVVQVPDSPQAGIHNPTQFSGMQAANPAAKINEIAPPSGNSSGDAALSYPLEVPPGRAGLQPGLALSYNSSGGNSWMGVGWDLSTPSIRVETRWGVPRYDSTNETETYLFNGQQLTPLAHRGDLLPRESEKEFHLRVEGGFVKIIRHGSHPSNYWWEVIDKQGTHMYYGGVNGTDSNSTLADSAGNIAIWSLTLVQDSNGNQMDYRSVKVLNNGQPGGTVPGQALYLDEIQYTGHANGETGPYTVNFIRSSGREDVMINGRYGFKQVVADLLTGVEVRYQGELVRAYGFHYQTGAFHKQLLESVVQYDADNVEFNRHDFSYYDESRSNPESSPNSYYGYTNPSTWNTHNDITKASAISGYDGYSNGSHLYIGFNKTKPTKKGSFGGKIGKTKTRNEGLLSLVDINGDGLPDKVFRDRNTVFYRANESGANGITVFSGKHIVASLPAISDEESDLDSGGAEYFPGSGHIGINLSWTTTTSSIFFSDVNGDGLIDLVNKGAILFNHINSLGHPEFTADSSDTPNPIGQASVDAEGIFEELQDIYDEQIANYPLIDTVRRWIAPFSGTVWVSGSPALRPVDLANHASADGVWVGIEHGGARLWHERIEANGANPVFNGLNLVVNKGDIIYFRVQSVLDGLADQVEWAPRIEYQNVFRPTYDVDGLDVYSYDASEDFTLAGYKDVDYTMPFNGQIRIEGSIIKHDVTSDDMVLEVLKNDSVIWSRTLTYNEVDTIKLDTTISVVEEVDKVRIRLRYDSPIDLSKIQWLSTDPLRFYYTARDDAGPVLDEHGDPLVQIDVLVDADVYSENNLDQPLQPTFIKTLGSGNVTANITTGGTITGEAVLVVKAPNQLIEKIPFVVPSNNYAVELANVIKGEEYYFQVVTRDHELGEEIASTLEVELDYDPVSTSDNHLANAGLYYPKFTSVVQAPYRGWSVFGYNGNQSRADDPIMITQADLTMTDLFDPTMVGDAQASIDEAVANGDPSLSTGVTSPSDLVVHAYTPNIIEQRMQGSSDLLWASSNIMSSSRMGSASISIPSASQLASAQAVSRISRTDQIATAGGVGTSGGEVDGSASISLGFSKSIVDYLDINGDRYPDVVRREKAQYSPMIGGLEDSSQSFNGIRKSDTTTYGFGVGGNYASSYCNSQGGCNSRANSGDNNSKGNSASTGTSNQERIPIGATGNVSTGRSNIDYDLLDINGDGLVDRVRREGSLLKVSLNVGYQFLAEEPWGSSHINNGSNESVALGLTASGFVIDKYAYGGGVSGSRNNSYSNDSLLDVNGDGLLDRVESSIGPRILVGLNTGNQFMPNIVWPTGLAQGLSRNTNNSFGGGFYFTIPIPLCAVACYLLMNYGADHSFFSGHTKTRIQDVNGDGYPDYLHSTEDDELSVSLAQIERTNMLKRVERPLGASFTLDYERSGNTYAQPHNRWVLNRVEIDDGFTGDGVDTLLTTYQYEDGYYDRREREFYGYARVIQEQRDASSAEALYRRQISEFNNANYYEKGLLLTSWLEDAAGNLYNESINRYAVRDVASGVVVSADHLSDANKSLYPYLERSEQRIYEGLLTPIKSTHTLFEYDQFGNTTRVTNANDIGSEDDVEAIIEYHYDLASYILATPNKITVYGDGDVYRRRESSIELGTGNVLQVSALLADGSAVVSNLLYDTYGNVVKVTAPPNLAGQRYERQFSYDTIAQQYVVQVNDSFGYTSTAQYDYHWGVPLIQVDINGHPIETAYDSVGRVVSVTGPYQQGTGRSTLSFTYAPDATVPWALTQHYDNYQHQSDPIETYTFIDGLGRAVQTKKSHSLATSLGNQPVMVVSGRQVYDHLGRVVESYYPVTEALGTQTQFNAQIDTVAPTTVQYDVLGRMIQTTLPDLTQMTVEYGQGTDKNGQQQLLKRVTDANGISSESYTDVRGLTLFTRQHNLAGGQDNIWTQFAYNPMNELITVTDDQGNITTSQYDHLGRRTSVDSPDGGLTTTEYDLASNIVAITTANLRGLGQSMHYEYDYTRLKQFVYPGDAQKNVYYHYGAPGASDNRVGRLARVEDESGWIDYSYGSLGEQVKTYRQLNYNFMTCGFVCTRDYETGFVYDSWNRLQGMVYPDGEVVHYDYDSGGALKSITGTKDGHVYGYVEAINYDKFGQRVEMRYGNGTVTRYDYDPADRVLVDLEARLANGELFMDYRYSYDQVNNITAIDNDLIVLDPGAKGGELHYTYEYDDLYRLISSTGVYDKHDRTHRYDSTFEYDRVHNFVRKQQHYQVEYADGGVVVQTPRTYDNSYAYTGTQPHAPTRIGDRDYHYDDNGNQLGWDLEGSLVSRQLIWDAHNRLAAVNDSAGGTSQYIYDHTGTRSIKSTENNLTSYVNGYYVARRVAGSEAQGSKHIFAGTDRVVSKVVEGEANAALGQTQLLVTQIGSGIPTPTLPPDPVDPSDPDSRDGGAIIGMTIADLEAEALILGLTFDEHVANLAANAQMTVEEYLRLFDQPATAPQQVDELTGFITFLAASNGYPYHLFIEAISPEELDEMINDPFWLMIRNEMGAIWERPWEWIEIFEWWYDPETGLAQLYCVSKGEPNEFSEEVCIPSDEADPDGNPGGDSGGLGDGDPELYERSQYYYHGNQVGSTTYLTDTYGQLYEHNLYFPYGDLWVNEIGALNPDPTIAPTDPKYLFTGKEFDQETGLYYYGARYYDPKTSVWLSVDPLEEAYPGWSPYAYTLNNPVNLIDPTGMYSEDPPEKKGSFIGDVSIVTDGDNSNYVWTGKSWSEITDNGNGTFSTSFAVNGKDCCAIATWDGDANLEQIAAKIQSASDFLLQSKAALIIIKEPVKAAAEVMQFGGVNKSAQIVDRAILFAFKKLAAQTLKNDTGISDYNEFILSEEENVKKMPFTRQLRDYNRTAGNFNKMVQKEINAKARARREKQLYMEYLRTYYPGLIYTGPQYIQGGLTTPRFPRKNYK